MLQLKEIAGLTVVLIMLSTTIYLILKRKKLEKSSWYFISAITLLTIIESYCCIRRMMDSNFNSSSYYIIGINLGVFLLYLLYFQNVLISKKLKRINRIIITIFLINYLVSAIAIDNFFIKFPFMSYFIEVVLLTSSIYLVLSQTFNSDRILTLGTYFPFWASINVLVIYHGVMPLLIVSYTAEEMMNLNVFFFILFLVNLIGYSILVFGIFRSTNKNRL